MKKNDKEAPATAVAPVPPDTNTALAGLDLTADLGLGFDNMSPDTLTIPRLSVLQSNSPQCTRGTNEYLADARPGDIFNSVTGAVVSGAHGVRVIVCHFALLYLEWVPRTKGGGFVKDHGSSRTILDECTQEGRKYFLANGNEIVPTAEYFITYQDDQGTWNQCALSMTSSQLRHSRKLNSMTMMRTVTVNGQRKKAPIFWGVYKFTTAPESNDQGTWFGWNIEADGDTIQEPNGRDLYDQARTLHQQVANKKIVAPRAEQETAQAPHTTEAF